MDFIEQIFGVSPDGGDGTLELLYIVAALAVIGAIVWRVTVRRRAARNRHPGAER
jgi:hypothetical protein